MAFCSFLPFRPSLAPIRCRSSWKSNPAKKHQHTQSLHTSGLCLILREDRVSVKHPETPKQHYIKITQQMAHSHWTPVLPICSLSAQKWKITVSLFIIVTCMPINKILTDSEIIFNSKSKKIMKCFLKLIVWRQMVCISCKPWGLFCSLRQKFA